MPTFDLFDAPSIAASATVLAATGQRRSDSIDLMLDCFARPGLPGMALAEKYAIFASYMLSGAAGLAISHVEASAPAMGANAPADGCSQSLSPRR